MSYNYSMVINIIRKDEKMSTAIVYGKENLKMGSKVLWMLYQEGYTRVQLHRGKAYDLHFSRAQYAPYVVEATGLDKNVIVGVA